jgi:hypothetical protein
MKAGWIIGLALAAVALGVYFLAPFGGAPAKPVNGDPSAPGAAAVAAGGTATLDAGTRSGSASDGDRARQPAALSGEARDAQRAEPSQGFGAAPGEPPPLTEISSVLPTKSSVNDNPDFYKQLEVRYARADSAKRLEALEQLNQRYESHLSGKVPEGEKGLLDDMGLERMQLEIDWLVQHPGS